MNLEEFKKFLAVKAFGITLQEAWEKGICILCREPAIPRCYSDEGRKEYKLSGTCEACFKQAVQ
jgi:hypothetical protein